MAELTEAYSAVIAAQNRMLSEMLHEELLRQAITNGYLHTVEWLCENSPTKKEDWESTNPKKNPLLYACVDGKLAVVRQLMACPHANADSSSTRLRNVPLHLACQSLYRAKVHGDQERQRLNTEIVRYLLLSPRAWNYAINAAIESPHFQNATLLKMMVCASKDLHIHKLLLHLGADPTICDTPHVLDTGDVSFIKGDHYGRRLPVWTKTASQIPPSVIHLLRRDARDWRVYRLMKARVICDVEHAVEKKAPLRAIDACLRERVRVLREEGKGKGERNMEEEEEEQGGLMPLPSVSTIKRNPQKVKEECTEALEEGAKKRQEAEKIDAVITHILHGGLKQELFVELCAMVRERDVIGQKGREYLSM